MEVIPAIAIVNSDDCRTAIWHVAVEPIPQISRLCGAWVTSNDKIFPQVLMARKILVCGERTPSQLKPLVPSVTGVIDIAATMLNIKKWMTKYERIHDKSPTPLGNERAPLPWPSLPELLKWDALPPPPRWVVDDKLIASTIVVARWIADLADTWAAIEMIRIGRKHLGGGSEQGPLPLALAAKAKA